MKHGIIIEDLPPAQEWLRDVVLTAYPEINLHLGQSVQDGLSLIAAHAPDLALIDLNLPDGSGIEIIQAITAKHPQTYTIVSTIYDDDQHLFPALRAGARGYLLKEQRKDQLVKLLKGIVNGEPPLSPSISQRLLQYFSPASPEVINRSEAISLTRREQEVLSIIAKGHNLNDAAELLAVSRNTVATHVKNIYSKLNISSRAEAAQMASQMGIIDQ